MKLSALTPKDIEKTSYNDLIGILKETNRPPGGKHTVSEVISKTFLNKDSKVLEIGTSTGFTAIEISRLVKCKIISIDINKDSLNEAKERSSVEGYNNIKFVKADVNKMPFKDKEFYLVFVGNILSLMNNKEKAFNECRRVCKKDGFIVGIPMYYIKTPPNKLVEEVSKAIKVNIKPLYKKDWMEFFIIPDIEIFMQKDFKFDYIQDEKIRFFVEDMVSRKHLKQMRSETLEKLREVYLKFMTIFRDNLSYMGYSIILLSNKRKWEDPELFSSKEIK